MAGNPYSGETGSVVPNDAESVNGFRATGDDLDTTKPDQIGLRGKIKQYIDYWISHHDSEHDDRFVRIANLLSSILAIDGSGSGINADLLDNLHGNDNDIDGSSTYATKRAVKEKIEEGLSIGDLKHNPRYIPISASHPWKNLADPDEELDIANYPDYVPVMRDIRIKNGFYEYMNIVSITVISNVATVLFFDHAYYIYVLNQLAEMLLDYTNDASPTSADYANWKMCFSLNPQQGTIPAGGYIITDINPSARAISFNVIAPNQVVTSVGFSGTFHPYRVPNDTTKCRHRQQLGKAIMTPDFETFFNGVSGRDNEIDTEGNDKGYFGAFLYQYLGEVIL